MDKYGHLFSEVHVQGVNAFDNLLEKSDKNKSTLIELNLYNGTFLALKEFFIKKGLS